MSPDTCCFCRQPENDCRCKSTRLELEASENALEATTSALQELLAVIHRDGGHHSNAVGIFRAAEDAEARVQAERSAADKIKRERDNAQDRVAVLEACNVRVGYRACRAVLERTQRQVAALEWAVTEVERLGRENEGLKKDIELLQYKETQWMGYIHPCEHEDAVGKMEYEIEKLKEENGSLRYLIAVHEFCSSQDIFDLGYCPQCGGLGGHRPVEVDIEGNALPCRWGSIAEGYWNEVDSEEEWE